MTFFVFGNSSGKSPGEDGVGADGKAYPGHKGRRKPLPQGNEAEAEPRLAGETKKGGLKNEKNCIGKNFPFVHLKIVNSGL